MAILEHDEAELRGAVPAGGGVDAIREYLER